MPLPTGVPVAIQTNWTNTNNWNMWDQPQANYLTTFSALEIDRSSSRGSLRTSTCRIRAYDPALTLRPGKTGALLYPNVRLGRRVRVLEQVAGGWHPLFFGYIQSYEPDTEDPASPNATLTLISPLAALAPRQVEMPLMDHPLVYSATGTGRSALEALFYLVGLLGTAYLNLEDVGHVAVPGDWGGSSRTFGEWLTDLCAIANCFLSDEPLYAAAAGEPDYELHWYRPQVNAPLDWHWSATAADLAAGARIEWNGDTP